MENKMISFASENYAGVHPKMMQALTDANTGHARSYGNDEYTAGATRVIQDILVLMLKYTLPLTAPGPITLASLR